MNKKILKERTNGKFLFYLTRGAKFDAYELLSHKSLIKLDAEQVFALVSGDLYPIHAEEKTDGKKGKNGIQRMKAKIKKPKAFISHTKALIGKHKK